MTIMQVFENVLEERSSILLKDILSVLMMVVENAAKHVSQQYLQLFSSLTSGHPRVLWMMIVEKATLIKTQSREN